MATPERPAGTGTGAVGTGARVGTGVERRTDETKPAFKTTEFVAYLAILAGVFIAGLVIKGGDNGTDELMANDVWLLAVILTFGYMLSRGIAKSGSRHRYDDDGGRH
jgi:hypothetical protein